ncbi:cytochrome P450 [Lophiostoma macrostomum CBS 122681]|uniref:Cytochrome P450 n=1 Tax=Lophiostoma macrostomum CBS 122681 TaxID=1314788 RepID=A0A6A6T9R0_9PLEO|nr:cytochrome P450 [Lophiostoma macrostomum CBS 122681]
MAAVLLIGTAAVIAGGNILWTCDPAIAKQLFTLHTVQVPVDLIRFHDIWGPTVGSVEGQEWKNHRKIINYGFGPSTLPIVWEESIHQTETLIDRWARDEFVVKSPRTWMSRIALHVIAGIFFDTRMDWKDTESSNTNNDSYTSSLPNAILTIMLHLGVLFVTPRWLLGKLPFEPFQKTNKAFVDFTNYMLELRAKVLEKSDEVSTKRSRTMLESIVVAGSTNLSDPTVQPLSKESILGNIFFMMMAGHETAGNTLGFALLLLAVHPDSQNQVQQEVDDVLGERPKSDWSVETDYRALQKGYLGAVLTETLRLYHPVQFVWRTNVAETTVYDSTGDSHVVPANTLFCVNFAAAFSNPSTWPQAKISSAKRADLHFSRALDFNPTKWVHTREVTDNPTHWPFGQGGRTCPGKAMAQIEMVAVLATLLKNYSIELVITEDVLKACGDDHRIARERTRDDAIRRLEDDVEANLTIAMLKDLPIRLRGRFDETSP